MSEHSVTEAGLVGQTVSRRFERFAGIAAVAVGLGGIGYSIAFITVLRNQSRLASRLTALLLLVGGILATAVLVAVYGRLRAVDPSFALWGLALGLVGAFGSAVHGGFDLAFLIKRTPRPGIAVNPVDPRGLLTFGLTALGLFVFSWLILRGGGFPRPIGYLGMLAAALLAVVYAGRLVIVDPESPGLLVAAVLSGFLVNPTWFIWVGAELMRPGRAGPPGR
jgi:hypothetical protein